MKKTKIVSTLGPASSDLDTICKLIEAGANEVTDEEMYNAIMFGHQQNVEICKFIDKIVEVIATCQSIPP